MKLSLVVALVAVVWIASSNAQNSTSPPEYRLLFPIPGSDFVGFGYDARYADPNQAVRLPLVEWNFNSLKTYKYPIYKQYVYRVPDELFTRTVARTDFTGFVYQGSEELSQKLSLSAGVNFSRTDTGPVDLSPEEEEMLLQTFDGNITTNGTSTDGVNLSPKQAGYGDALTLPVHQRGTSTNTFSIGAEVNFIKGETEKRNKWVTTNEQINEYYQLFLDKRVLRESLQEDIDALAGRRWFSEDRKLFQAFFEKYGTHVVVSAMMGGAISQSSIIDKFASQDVTSVGVSVNLNFTATEVTAENETKVQEFVPGRPECENFPDTRGYLFDTLNEECVLPPQATCFAPMNEVLNDPFEGALKEFDPEEEETLDGTLRWHTPGPYPLIMTNRGTRWCPRLRMCPPLETVELERENNTDGFPRFSGQITGQYKVDVTVTDQREADTGHNFYYKLIWRIDEETNTESAEHYATVFPSKAQCNAYCSYRNQPVEIAWKALLHHCKNYPHHVHQFCTSCFYEDGCRYVNPTFARGPAISGGGTLIVDSTQQLFTFPRTGAWAEVRATKPGLFSFKAFAQHKNGYTNWVELIDDGTLRFGDEDYLSDDRIVTSFVMTPYGMGLLSGENNAAATHVPYQENQWYQINIQLDWASNRAIMWYNTDGNSTLIKGGEVPFTAQAVNVVSKIYVWNFYSGTLGQLDDFKFCNEYQKSKYTPVSRESAVKSSTAKFSQAVTGNVDFSFETTRGSMSFSQTTNYRLKGGDSSLVDLLDHRKTTEVFETWKHTIAYNPAPVNFILKKISSLFPTTVVDGVEQRAEMELAIDEFTTEEITGELIYDQSPDIPGGIPQPA